MKMLARSYFWWPGLDADIEDRARACDPCAAVAAQEVPVPLHQWEPAEKPWTRLHADFAEHDGKRYIVIIDAFSKWPEVKQLTSTTAKSTSSAFSEVFAQNGLPEVLVTDNGPPFQSQEFRNFLQANGIRHVLTPPYHPQSNGLAENFVRTFKTAIRRAAEEGEKDCILNFLVKYRVTPHVTTGRPPCEMLNGRHYRHTLDLICPGAPAISARERMARDHQKRNYDKRSRDRYFEVNERVWVLDPARKSHWKIGVVLGKLGSAIYVVQDENRRQLRVHKDHIKPRNSAESWSQGFVDVPLPPLEFPGNASANEDEVNQPAEPGEANDADGHVQEHGEGSGDAAPRRYPTRVRKNPQRYGYN